MELTQDRVLIIGVGNEFRSDDGVGPQIAQWLAAMELPYVDVVQQSGEGAGLMACWQTANSVILVDAVQANGRPGAVHRFDVHQDPFPSRFFHYSTHAFSVAEAIELSRALGQLPARLVVYGIEGANFCAGLCLSPAIEAAAETVLQNILRDVEEQTHA